jgi:single-stranded DNA-binding protein
VINRLTLTMTAHDHPESRAVGDKTVTKVRARASQGKDKDGSYKPSIWLDVEAWSPSWSQKDIAGLRKDDRFTASGRLSVREWEDKEGRKRESWSLVVDAIEAPRREQQDSAPPPGRRERTYSSDQGRQAGRAPQRTQDWQRNEPDDEPLPF